jgi:hypothetical protein
LFSTFSENNLGEEPLRIRLRQIIALLRPRPRARCLLNSTTTFVVSHQTISMTTAPRTGRSALEEFLPEVDIRRDNVGSLMDPREIQLEPLRDGSDLMDNSTRAQLWPMLAAALVGLGAAILAFAAFSQLAP